MRIWSYESVVAKYLVFKLSLRLLVWYPVFVLLYWSLSFVIFALFVVLRRVILCCGCVVPLYVFVPSFYTALAAINFFCGA